MLHTQLELQSEFLTDTFSLSVSLGGVVYILNKIIPFRKRMAKYSNFVFKDASPDNNGSERAIRNFKIKLKGSGFLKSFDGAETFTMLRSVIDTAIKDNRNPLHITKLIAQCNNAIGQQRIR